MCVGVVIVVAVVAVVVAVAVAVAGAAAAVVAASSSTQLVGQVDGLREWRVMCIELELEACAFAQKSMNSVG